MAASIDTTHFSPSANTFDNMMDSTTQQPQFLKMEDLQTSSSPTPPAFDQSTTSSQTSPAPVIVHSKPAKKRKSWGQELPEPKTTLPPRKRAKTDDEKEQRRIERIKRNRAAAHNSRERKRQETDTLAVLLARANAELDAYRKLHGPLPPSVVLPEVTLSTEEEPTPAPSLSASRGSIDAAASPASPADTVMSSHPTIKQEPYDLTIDAPAFDMLAPKSSLPQLDVTQHSAAMLCDLQCPSSLRASKTSSPTSLSSTFQASWWTAMITYLIILQIRTCYQQILTALWTISPSKMGLMIQASTTRLATIRSRSTTSSMTTPSLSRLTRPLAQLNAATGLVSRKGAQAALVRQSSLAMMRAMNGRAGAMRRSVKSTGALRKDQDSEKHGQGCDDGVRRSGAD